MLKKDATLKNNVLLDLSLSVAKFWVARSLRDNYRTGKFLTNFAVWHSRKNRSATIQSKCHLETTITGYMCIFVYRENDKIECNHLCPNSCSIYRFQYLPVRLIMHTKWCLESLEKFKSSHSWQPQWHQPKTMEEYLQNFIIGYYEHIARNQTIWTQVFFL
jgi:hypothetical protein